MSKKPNDGEDGSRVPSVGDVLTVRQAVALVLVAIVVLLFAFNAPTVELGTSTDETDTPATPEDVDISIVALEVDGTVAATEAIDARVTLENAGNDTGTQTVSLDAGGIGTASREVTVPGGESTTESITIDTDGGDAGEYTVAAAIGEQEVSTTTTVTEAETGTGTGDDQDAGQAAIEISSVRTNASVRAGEPLEATVELTNTGNASGSETASLDAGPLGSDSTEATIEAGETTTATLAVQTSEDDAGEYTLTITAGDDEVSQTVTVTPAPEPTFEVGIRRTNVPVEAGELVQLTVGIENTGESAGTQEVAIDAGGLGTDSAIVSLDAGESTTETFTVSTADGDAGDYNITVSSDDDTVTASAAVRSPPEPAFFSIDSVDANTSVTAGDDLPVTVTVRNTGDLSGTQTVQVDGGQLDSTNRSLSLPADESTEETFVLETDSGDDAGEYTIAATSNNDSARTTVTVEEAQPGEFTLIDLSADTPASPGEGIPVSVRLRNTGDETGTRLVEASVSVLGSDSTSVTLTPNQPTVVRLSVPTGEDSEGDYLLTVTVGDISRTLTVTVSE